MFANHIYLIYMAFIHQELLMCHKTQPKQSMIQTTYKKAGQK